MNIFILDKDPMKAAMMLCDRHVPKMIVESAQMLISIIRVPHGLKKVYKTTIGTIIIFMLWPKNLNTVEVKNIQLL